MKQSAHLAELALRLRMNQDFQEYWKLVRADRDNAITEAIYPKEGDPAEKRGAARALDTLVKQFEEAPDKTKHLNAMR